MKDKDRKVKSKVFNGKQSTDKKSKEDTDKLIHRLRMQNLGKTL